MGSSHLFLLLTISSFSRRTLEKKRAFPIPCFSHFNLLFLLLFPHFISLPPESISKTSGAGDSILQGSTTVTSSLWLSSPRKGIFLLFTSRGGTDPSNKAAEMCCSPLHLPITSQWKFWDKMGKEGSIFPTISQELELSGLASSFGVGMTPASTILLRGARQQWPPGEDSSPKTKSWEGKNSQKQPEDGSEYHGPPRGGDCPIKTSLGSAPPMQLLVP